jgi:hypothetical protein
MLKILPPIPIKCIFHGSFFNSAIRYDEVLSEYENIGASTAATMHKYQRDVRLLLTSSERKDIAKVIIN